MTTRSLINAFATRCRLSTRQLSSAYRRVRQYKDASNDCIMYLGRVSGVPSNVRPFLGNMICFVVGHASMFNCFAYFSRIEYAFRSSNGKIRLQPPYVTHTVNFGTFNNVLFNGNESGEAIRPTQGGSSMECIKRRLAICNVLGNILGLPNKEPTIHLLIILLFVFRPIANMPTFRHPLLTIVMISKWRKFMLITRPFRHFRFTTRVSVSFNILSCVWECCASKIPNGRMFIFFFVVGNGNRSTIRLFGRVGAFITMGNRSRLAIAPNSRFMTTNVLNTSIAIIVSFTIGHRCLLPIK